MDEPVRTKEGFTVHKALTTTKKGYIEFEIEVPSKDQSVPLLDRLEMLITNQAQNQPSNELQSATQGRTNDIYSVYNNSQFALELVKLEETHPQRRKEMKIGVMYCKKGQILPSDMFQNKMTEESDSQFSKFINLMGHEIQLEDWNGYKGDMGNKGKTYYEKWRDIDIIYHVAPMLNAEGHRRLIGNDICVVFFLEEGEDVFFIPTHLSNLGTVPQVHAVIQPVGNNYRVAFFSNINIKPFGPAVPEELLTPEEMKNIVLTKAHNGLLMTKYCPPINRLFFVPRGEFLEGIIAKFPYESKKARKAREKEERKLLQDQGGEKLILKTIAAKQLAIPKEKLEHTSPFLMVSILDQKEKTKPIKATAFPVWNAEFIFSLVGVNEVYDDLQIVCLDHNNHAEYLGEVKFTLKDVREKAKIHMNEVSPGTHNNPDWYPLLKRGSNETIGHVYLKFSLLEYAEEPNKQEKNLEKDKVVLTKVPKSAKGGNDKSTRRLSM
uniref:Rap-GAP domain-containing protein n=1 Tax=Arcella intermedia TaxID=1963864 RepID=A0A6B2L258_9EUKA